MTATTWNAGPPPHIGWWHTCWRQRPGTPPCRCWRWWDGQLWSQEVAEDDGLPHLLVMHFSATHVRWCRYWPADARRPRLDPSDGHWTFNTDGRQPAYAGRIEVIYRDGWKIMGDNDRVPDASVWKCNQDNLDIVAWRPARPEVSGER